MENSMNSSIKNQAMYSSCSEESGWTVYFEDFFTNNNREYDPSSSGFGTSSLVSDAASCADLLKRSSKKLSFKKRKTIRTSVYADDDDALEDTASSPVNSPKISERQLDILNPRNKDGNIHSFQDRSTTSTQYTEVQQTDRRNEYGFMTRENDCTTELKKRGLCLVPLSMIVNYLG